MYTILVQQKVAKALGGLKCLPDLLTEEQKFEAMEMAFSSIILHLDDKVLREVSVESTAAGLWKKLGQLDRIYLKGKFFGYKMNESKSIRDNLDEFNRLILDLENLDIKIEEKDKAIIVLNSLPKSHATFVETMKYAREFTFSGRLDNMASSFCALRALVDTCASPEDLENEHKIRMVALFDNEEVGSDSYQGAGAPTMFQAMRRISANLGQQTIGECRFARAIRNS